MAKHLYLRAVERALRQDVLPDVREPVARDTIAACLNILVAVMSGLDTEPVADTPGFDIAALPTDVRDSFASATHVALPAGLPDDIAVRGATIAWIDAADRWVRAAFARGGQDVAISALLSWERAQRAGRLARLASADIDPLGGGDAGVADIDRERLQHYLTGRFGPDARIVSFRRLMGGRSRQTALFSQEGIADLPHDLVVQRDNPVYTGVPGVDIQGPVIAAANAAGMLAPKPYIIESGREWLGAPFMIMERLPGEPIIDATTEYFAAPPGGLRSVALGLAVEMAKLHAMPIGKLATTLTTSFDRQSGTWADEAAALRARLADLSRGPSIVMSLAMAWIERYAEGIGNRWSVVHTDMLLHNLLAENGAITGVLDWELAHIGHPGEDLGYVRPVIEQIMPWDEFMAAYAEAGGTPLTAEESDFFSLYAGVRLLTLVQVPRKLFEAGVTADLRLAETAASFIPQQVDRIDRILQSVMARGIRTG